MVLRSKSLGGADSLSSIIKRIQKRLLAGEDWPGTKVGPPAFSCELSPGMISAFSIQSLDLVGCDSETTGYISSLASYLKAKCNVSILFLKRNTERQNTNSSNHHVVCHLVGTGKQEAYQWSRLTLSLEGAGRLMGAPTGLGNLYLGACT